ncbi:MAG: hypothetical protein V4710_00700 [Verrucomicrobiota bacterium]
MSSEFQLQLRFKGARQYLQGPDIYNALCDTLAERGWESLEKIDVVFHKMAASQLTGRIYLGQDVPASEPNVVFRAVSKGQALTVLLEEGGESIAGRVPYDEEALVARTTLDADQKRISVPATPGYSNIEAFVALNKSLLLRSFPEAKGRWLFARLQMAQSFRHTPFEQFEVRFQGHSNFRITRSVLLGDGRTLGSLYFSLLPEG